MIFCLNCFVAHFLNQDFVSIGHQNINMLFRNVSCKRQKLFKFHYAGLNKFVPWLEIYVEIIHM